MIFEKHLLSVSRAASQWLGILKSWRVFNDRLLLWRWFQGLVLPVLENCQCSAAYTHLKLLDRVVSGSSFLTVGVFQCNIEHRRSVSVISVLYKISVTKFSLFMVLYLCHIYYSAVTRGARVAHRYTYGLLRCWTAQYRRTFLPLSVSLWNDLADPAFDVVLLPDFKRIADGSYWPKFLAPF